MSVDVYAARPQDLEAERVALAAVFLGGHEARALALGLEVDCFDTLQHRAIYRAVSDLSASGLDPSDLLALYARVGEVPRVREAVTAILDESTVNLPHYLDRLRDALERRRVLDGSRRLMREIVEGEPVTTALGNFGALVAGRPVARESWRETVLRTIAEIVSGTDTLRRIPTGIPALDRVLGGGLERGWLAVIMASPKAGKTALALQIAMETATAGKRVLFFSLEMGPTQLARRALAYRSGVPLSRLASDRIRSLDHADLYAAGDAVCEWPLVVVSSISGVGQIAQITRQQKDLGLVVVDYMQLVSNGLENTVADLTATSRGLKLLASELDVPVLALCQPTKEARGRKLTRHDASGSGAIEADADVMVLLHRTDPENEPFRVDVSVAAFRHGLPGTVPCHFDGGRQRFLELAPGDLE